MIISDLNYLEANEDAVFGGFVVASRNSSEVTRVDIDINIRDNKNFNSKVNVSGAAAVAEATVLGTNDSATQTFTYLNNGVNSSGSIAFAKF
ncbi:hypothetical protein DSM106972_005130 [Dulcicalothrix desertica PCC 7102]|uniref:Uncharacterized protein n=1 Tax=Dulcicalothrix desertica PCC 7102 TaxID=232991 RepID=A0A3S1CV91_9CYAN|nr:hypothetical protein [Dulcicalothrix desertica]RUT10018.1 hypothetical protein DSM106972_005130 [Dulcicalothrix desertica PCC 7102]TWH41003.1 hypothetical protein CAL7102_10367 [Dulcicalothrix desertica PCC 7102]